MKLSHHTRGLIIIGIAAVTLLSMLAVSTLAIWCSWTAPAIAKVAASVSLILGMVSVLYVPLRLP